MKDSFFCDPQFILNQNQILPLKTPRFFTTDPTNRWLYVLNEESDSLVRFNLDITSGALSATGKSWEAGSPVCMVFN